MWQVHDGMGWWMVFGGLLWLAIWATVAYLIATLAASGRSDRAERGGPASFDDPVEIARRRYAAGEIDRDEFVRLTEDLHERERVSAGHRGG